MKLVELHRKFFLIKVFTYPFRLLNIILNIFIEVLERKRRIISKSDSNYFGDNFATRNHVEFFNDQNFVQIYNDAYIDLPKTIKEVKQMDIIWRAHICTWAIKYIEANKIRGDFIELGTWFGLLAKVICEYNKIDSMDRVFHLFDNWGGDKFFKHKNYKYNFDIYEIVKKRFKEYKNVKLHRGILPDILFKKNAQINQISFLIIDLNTAKPEYDSLLVLYDKISSGGIIFFDDYGNIGCEELRDKINLFFKGKKEKLLHFPSGNSIVIKS
jgi:hypothetical protein